MKTCPVIAIIDTALVGEAPIRALEVSIVKRINGIVTGQYDVLLQCRQWMPVLDLFPHSPPPPPRGAPSCHSCNFAGERVIHCPC